MSRKRFFCSICFAVVFLIVPHSLLAQRTDFYSGKQSIEIDGTMYVISEHVLPLSLDHNTFRHSITISNVHSPLSGEEWPHDIRTGMPSEIPDRSGLLIDSTSFREIISDIFSDRYQYAGNIACYNDDTAGVLKIFAKADPRTGQILNIKLNLSCKEHSGALLSIPPATFKRLEEELYLRGSCYLPLPWDQYRPEFQCASFLMASAVVYFTDNDLVTLLDQQ